MAPSNIKEWLWSAKVLTTIVWILFPVGYSIIVALLDIPSLVFVFTLFTQGIFLSESLIFHVPFMAFLFLFAVYPAIYTTDKLFKKRGSTNVVIEYQYIRKILYVFLIAEIVIIITPFFLIPFTDEQKQNLGEQLLKTSDYNQILSITKQMQAADLPLNFVDTMIFMLPAVPLSILVKLLLEHARKQFRFYYAKACFEIINKTESESDKTAYLILGLNWYNGFVKRITKSGIDIETIYSKIVSYSQLSDNILLDTIGDSFHGADELKPMRHMLALLSCWKEGGGVLIKQSLRAKIRESSDLLIPIVTIIITILSTFFLKTSK